MTSTFAWFKASSATTLDTSAVTNAGIGVEKTVSELTYKAKVHVEADTTGLESIELTTWGAASGKGTATDTSKLYTAVRPANAGDSDNATNVTFTACTTVNDEVLKIPLKAWIEDTSSDKTDLGHGAAWEAGVEGMTSNYTVTVTYSYDQDVDIGTLLLDTEVFFYVNENNTADYASNKEGISGASGITQHVQVDARDLVGDTDYIGTTSENATKLTVGYLYVRAEGNLRAHNQASYTATITAAQAIS